MSPHVSHRISPDFCHKRVAAESESAFFTSRQRLVDRQVDIPLEKSAEVMQAAALVGLDNTRVDPRLRGGVEEVFKDREARFLIVKSNDRSLARLAYPRGVQSGVQMHFVFL